MLILDDPASFTALSYLLGEYGFNDMKVVGKYVYYSKNNLSPIQVTHLKINYTELELSSYAVQVGESTKKFISRFNRNE